MNDKQGKALIKDLIDKGVIKIRNGKVYLQNARPARRR